MGPRARSFAVEWTAIFAAVSLACVGPRAPAAAPDSVASPSHPNVPGPTTAATVDPAPDPVEVWTRSLAALATLADTDLDPELKQIRRDALKAEATAALAAVPDDHPRALEIVCEAATHGWPTRPQWTRAAAIDERRPVGDPQARYASLSRDTLRLSRGYAYASHESVRTSEISHESELREHPPTLIATCATIDHAAIRWQLSRVSDWQTQAKIYDELYREIERDLGEHAPALATLIELGGYLCSNTHNTAPCPPTRRQRHERALQLREQTLGGDHPLTHASRLNVAMLLEPTAARAVALLRRVEASAVRDTTTIFAMHELAWPDIRRKRWRPASERMCAASRLAQERVDTPGYLRDSTLDLCAHLLTYAGDYGAALEAFRLGRKVFPRGRDPRLWSYGVAEVLREAGDYSVAIQYYDEFLAAWTAIGWAMGADESLAAGHRGRAAALAGASRDALAHARAFEQLGEQRRD